MQYGREHRHEKTEKKNTINAPGTPILVALRSRVYASPAAIPPNSPMRAGKEVSDAGVLFARIDEAKMLERIAADNEARKAAK